MFEEKQQIISQKFTFDHALFVVMTSNAVPMKMNLGVWGGGRHKNVTKSVFGIKMFNNEANTSLIMKFAIFVILVNDNNKKYNS